MKTYPGREIIATLRNGGTVELDGALFVIDGDGVIAVGDVYIGARNTVQLLTAKVLHEDGYIIPETMAYPFDKGECVKVQMVA